MAKKKTIEIEVPKHPVIRYRFDDDRHITLDLRGIRDYHSPFNGGTNPSQGGGRKFLTPEHLQCMVNEYFESCMGPRFNRNGDLVKDKQGNIVKELVKPPTVSGLALHLGISTQTLKTYREGRLDSILDEMKAETSDWLTFSKVVLRAKQTIEAYAEGRLYDRDGFAGAKHVLDVVFDWVSRREQADIDRSKSDSKLRREEFDLKKRLIDEGADDNDITINIVRKQADDS